MVGYGRMKKVTDPLDDRVKARIVGRDPGEPGYVSSGSEHSEQGDGAESSPSFSDLLFCFAGDGDAGDGLPENGSDEEGDLSAAWETTGQAVEDAVGAMMNNDSDLFRRALAVNVSKAVEMYACLNSSKQVLRRSVMGFLRGLGYNAAVCKTKWEGSGGLTAGNHEFIDVIRPDAARYLVDLDFASEFQIARPTKHYERLVQSMPRTFVGKPEQLKQILKAVSDAARRSLKSRGLHIPPWRKHRFMLNKWLGSYKRTTNPLPSGNPPPLLPPSKQTLGIKCRSIGFDAAVNGRLLYPTATRTR